MGQTYKLIAYIIGGDSAGGISRDELDSHVNLAEDKFLLGLKPSSRTSIKLQGK